MCVWHLRDDDVFDPVAFATGLSAIIVTVCTGVAVKRFATPAAVPGTTTINSSSSKVETVVDNPKAGV
jgi:hypothetical protein